MQHSSLLTLLVALLVIKIPIVAVRLHTMLPSFQASTHTAQTDVASTQQCPEGTVDDLAEVPNFQNDCRLLLEQDHLQHLQRVRILDLHPTQLAVGMQQVGVKEELMVHKQLLQKPKKLEKFILKNPLPAVKGPGGELYIVDHHHLASAMVKLGIQEAYVDIIQDWRSYSTSAFWHAMVEAKYLWPHDERGNHVEWHDLVEKLPHDVTGLKDDPYRSLSAIVRKAGGYTKVWVPFSEFQWANYFRTVLPDAKHDPANEQVVAAAVELAQHPNSAHLPGHHHSRVHQALQDTTTTTTTTVGAG